MEDYPVNRTEQQAPEELGVAGHGVADGTEIKTFADMLAVNVEAHPGDNGCEYVE